MRQLALALQAAHARDIVHRDLKPANIFLVDDPGGRTVVKVLDFGLARRMDANDSNSRSNPLGTHAYMSPEQINGAGAKRWSDCYAAGVVWYELLTGINPFRAESLAETLNRHAKMAPPPSSLVPTIPADVDALVLRLLAKDPPRRPDAQALLDELDLLLADANAVGQRPAADATRRLGRPPRAPSPRASRAGRVLLSAALLSGIALLLLFPPCDASALDPSDRAQEPGRLAAVPRLRRQGRGARPAPVL